MKNHKNGFTLLNETAHTLYIVPFNMFCIIILGKMPTLQKDLNPVLKYDT